MAHPPTRATAPARSAESRTRSARRRAAVAAVLAGLAVAASSTAAGAAPARPDLGGGRPATAAGGPTVNCSPGGVVDGETVGRGADVSAAPNLSGLPARALVGKRLVADLTACPTLGATNPGIQINPLMDNYEALAIDPRGPARGRTVVTVLSDDNFGATQVTRLLRVAVRLP